jgi:hypothetical protein
MLNLNNIKYQINFNRYLNTEKKDSNTTNLLIETLDLLENPFNPVADNKLNESLLKQLIDVDFPYVKSSWKENKLNSIDLRINVKKYDYYNILNLYTLNTSIKQFIRTLRYLTKHKECHIYFWTSNHFILELIQSFAKEYSLEETIFASKIFPVIPIPSDTENPPVKFLFILGEPWLKKISHIVKKKIYNADFFLVNHFTFSHKRDTFGMYEIKNDLSDYKKIIVLLSIIDIILKSKNKKNKDHKDRNKSIIDN